MAAFSYAECWQVETLSHENKIAPSIWYACMQTTSWIWEECGPKLWRVMPLEVGPAGVFQDSILIIGSMSGLESRA